MDLSQTINAYHGKTRGEVPWRYRSWEHCFGFFRRLGSDGVPSHRDEAALQLGFYLASWGMYRGSSFLLQYDYTVHLPAIDAVAEPRFAPLFATDIGASDDDIELVVPLLLDAIKATRKAYKPIGEATDTLVTKVLLGILGCIPACDRFFIDGFTSTGYPYSYLNRKFLNRILEFSRIHHSELLDQQSRITTMSGLHYPLMKLIDMHFWQIGYERWAKVNRSTEALPVVENASV